MMPLYLIVLLFDREIIDFTVRNLKKQSFHGRIRTIPVGGD